MKNNTKGENQEDGTVLESTNEIINIEMIIDTDKIMSKYPLQTNPNQNNPVGLDHTYQYMVASTLSAQSGSGTGDLSFKANVGDVVRFNMISEYDNFDNAVIMYNVGKFGGDAVFGPFSSKVFTKTAVIPATGTSPLPPTFEPMKFWYYETDILKTGTENFNISFALYKRDRNNPNPVLYGYFYWDPTVIVKS